MKITDAIAALFDHSDADIVGLKMSDGKALLLWNKAGLIGEDLPEYSSKADWIGQFEAPNYILKLNGQGQVIVH